MGLDSPSSAFSDSEESESMPFMDLLLKLETSEQDWNWETHGYSVVHKICDTLQGELYKCKVEKDCLPKAPFGSFVAIKKTDKALFDDKIAVKDDMTYIVDEDIVREANILRYLTNNLKSNANQNGEHRVVQFLELFETESDYYLVMEYVEGEHNLADFVKKAFELMRENKLSKSEYHKTIKNLLFQIVSTIHWLHDVMKCTHLNLCLENIMISNAEWIRSTDSLYKMNKDITIKLGEFGVSELCDVGKFKFTKSKSFERESLISPQMFEDRRYDSRCSDMWSMGMIFYECMTGKPLYTPEDMWDAPNGGYLALKQRKLKKYLIEEGNYEQFQGSAMSLLLKLLKRNESKRIKAAQVMKHKWFTLQYQQYVNKLIK